MTLAELSFVVLLAVAAMVMLVMRSKFPRLTFNQPLLAGPIPTPMK